MGVDDAIEMFVGGLVIDPNTQSPVVVLKNESGDFCLPIWIGAAEATSIASAIKQVALSRPLTHDLMYDLCEQLSVRVDRVVVTELKESTYYAELVLVQGDRILMIDSRPSDAIAMALRASAPIYVAQKVLEQAKIVFSQQAPSDASSQDQEIVEGGEDDEEGTTRIQKNLRTVDREQWAEILKNLDPDDFKYEM